MQMTQVEFRLVLSKFRLCRAHSNISGNCSLEPHSRSLRNLVASPSKKVMRFVASKIGVNLLMSKRTSFFGFAEIPLVVLNVQLFINFGAYNVSSQP